MLGFVSQGGFENLRMFVVDYMQHELLFKANYPLRPCYNDLASVAVLLL
jgi:hypothetical protein